MKKSSLRSPIPPKIREQLGNDLFMSHCCLSRYDSTCLGRVQFHHNLTYAGKRQSDIWSILPACESHHRREAQYREELEYVMAARIFAFGAEDEAEIKYPKRKWKRLLWDY